MSVTLKYWLWGLLLLGTATVTSHDLEVGIMGLMVFVLAYLTKGTRREQSMNKPSAATTLENWDKPEEENSKN